MNPPDELDIYELIKRLENVERIDLDERLTYIEKQLKFFSYACQQIDASFKHGIKVSVDEKALSIIDPIKEVIDVLRSEVLSIRQLRKELHEQLQSESVLGTLKFVAQRLHELVQTVHSIKEDGIKKDIHLNFTVDGYEMVKKKPPNLNCEQEVEEKFDPEQSTIKLLESLSEKEKNVLIHRYGLLGEKQKTLKETGKLFGVTQEPIRQVQAKALRKCRLGRRKALAENLTHLELRHAILGK